MNHLTAEWSGLLTKIGEVDLWSPISALEERYLLVTHLQGQEAIYAYAREIYQAEGGRGRLKVVCMDQGHILRRYDANAYAEWENPSKPVIVIGGDSAPKLLVLHEIAHLFTLGTEITEHGPQWAAKYADLISTHLPSALSLAMSLRRALM